MSEYTPSTEIVKVRYAIGHGGLSHDEEDVRADGFDRWLASVQAEAWDEGRSAGWADRAPGVYPDEFHTNPYKKGSDDE